MLWAGLGLVTLVISGSLWWWIPKLQMRSIAIADPKAHADIEDNFRKTIGQALGGGVALIGAALAYVQFSQQQQTSAQQSLQQQQIASRQIVAQQKISADQIAAQLQAAEISRALSEEIQISNQVARGFEQLGSGQLVTRLGGIYALEGVMNGSSQYSISILDSLCAFVRDRTSGLVPSKSPLDNNIRPATDVQAALTVIGRRKTYKGIVDLRQAQIQGANLESANLVNADLTDSNLLKANLRGANLSSAKLSHVELFSADLRDANLSSADLSKSDLYLADLEGADLERASLENTNIDAASLRQAAGISQSQLDKTCANVSSLPSGLNVRPCLKPH